MRDAANVQEVPAVSQPIIDHDTFDQVQAAPLRRTESSIIVTPTAVASSTCFQG
jgi:hypothetical protein